ncbi:DHH family phosphoesterase [Candidatus Shapirobacteria bacterium]|nr:DHH family phosphoesterase [Candidatus Shapirobacteria bacterium]
MLYITSYSDPDIDCVACTLGYVELLTKIGTVVEGVYFGEKNLEIDFVEKYTNSFSLKKHLDNYDDADKFILVDSSDPTRVDPRINIDNVIELYDHRQTEQVKLFSKATVHIDLVGSCATLICEEFRKNGFEPSRDTAIYLYSAIASNTVNFKNALTTNRDVEMAAWLKDIANIPDSYIREMFLAKSMITPKNFYEVLRQDIAVRPIAGKKVGIAQVEMVDVKRVETDLKPILLSSLNQFVKDNKLDYMFFNGIDIVEGYNIFYTIDEVSNKLFLEALGIPGLKPGFKTDSILMRKQIFRKVEEYLSQ